VPAARKRMKAGKEHRVPLSPAAIALIQSLPKVHGTNLVFPSSKSTPLSDMTLTGVLRRMGVDAVPSRFQIDLQDWASERTNYPAEMSEMALAHTISDRVEAAYRRGDLFDKRGRMMADWAEFCSTPAPGGKVLPLKKKRA
jgi:integrase